MSLFHTHRRMAQAVSIRRTRKLGRGEVARAAPRTDVGPLDVISQVDKPRALYLLDAAQALNLPPETAEQFLRKREGSQVKPGEDLAVRPLLGGVLNRRLSAPVEGSVAYIGEGQVLIAGQNEHTEHRAYVPAAVMDVEPLEYITFEITCALMQLAWGHGAPVWGELHLADASTSEFSQEHKGAIVVTDAPLTPQQLTAALTAGLQALIGPSARASLLPHLEASPIATGLLYGFGALNLDDEARSFLMAYSGRQISFTPEGLDWRDPRPEIMIPVPDERGIPTEASFRPEAAEGVLVQVLRGPYQGQVGRLSRLLKTPQALQSGLRLPGAMITMPDRAVIFVPLVNLEYIG